MTLEKFELIRFTPVFPTHTQHIWVLSIFSLLVFFGFLLIRTGQTVRPILTVDGSEDVFWRKVVPFGG